MRYKKYERAFYVASFQFFTTMSSVLTVDRILGSDVNLSFLLLASFIVSTINFFLAFFREMEREAEENERYVWKKKTNCFVDNLLPL